MAPKKKRNIQKEIFIRGKGEKKRKNSDGKITESSDGKMTKKNIKEKGER